jgi:hypothetical protein
MKTGAALRPFPTCNDPELLSLLELGKSTSPTWLLLRREDKEVNVIDQVKTPLPFLVLQRIPTEYLYSRDH